MKMLINDDTMCIVSINNNIGGRDIKTMTRREYLTLRDTCCRNRNHNKKQEIKLIRMI